DRHAVRLVQRRQHEQIGPIVQSVEARRIELTCQDDAVVQAIGLKLAAQPLHGRRVAREASGTSETPASLGDRSERAEQDRVTFAPIEGGDAQKLQRPVAWVSVAAVALGAPGAARKRHTLGAWL